MREGILNELSVLPKPWIITFAYGTNDWHFEKNYKQSMEAVFKMLADKYPQTPVFILLPIARSCETDKMKYGTLQDGTHPNNEGMRYLGKKVTEDILKYTFKGVGEKNGAYS